MDEMENNSKGLICDEYFVERVFDRSGLYVIAGVKGVGKTTFLKCLAEAFRASKKDKGLVVCYADKKTEPFFSEQDYVKNIDMSQRELPIKTGHILCEAEWMEKDYGLTAILVDDYRYLMRMEEFPSKELTCQEKVLYLLTRFKTLAEIYNVPVIATTGVDDDYVYGRNDKRIQLSDIPDHDYVRLLADHIILLHRDEVFHEDTEKKGIAEMRIIDLPTETCVNHHLAFIKQDDICGFFSIGNHKKMVGKADLMEKRH